MTNKNISGYRLLTVKVLIWAIAVIAVTSGCATKGALGGGPKDTTPPKVVQEEPPMGSRMFKGDKVSITFNEFVKLKDATKNILISPPLKEQPEYKLHGKTLSVGFNEPLADSTTYSIFFGDAIIDITEGNVLSGYTFVFSTGPVIDSLAIEGKVTDAFTGQPVENTITGLYCMADTMSFPDSIVMKQPPRYITRCTKEGTFTIGYITPGRYILFALNDQDGNYYYHPYSEAFAFVDSTVMLKYPPADSSEMQADSSMIADSVNKPAAGDLPAKVADSTDTIARPSDSLVKGKILPRPSFTLSLFTEQDSVQRISSKERTPSDAIRITLRYPLAGARLQILNPDSVGRVYTVFNPTNDTLDIWTPESQTDTVDILITGKTGFADTVRMPAQKRELPGGRRSRRQEAPSLSLKTNISGQMFPFFSSPRFIFNQPVAGFDTAKCMFIADADTLRPLFVAADSNNMRFDLRWKLKQESSYKLIINDSAFRSITGLYNRKTSYSFKASTPEDYGLLRLKITTNKPGVKHLVQWLTEKDKVISTQLIRSDTTLTFPNLTPGKYKLKVILDTNGNNHWDTGSYMRLIQPEATLMREGTIEIRANWELEEEWKMVF